VGSLLPIHAVLTAGYLAAAVLARQSDAGRRYWPLLFAFFVGGTAVLLSTLFADRLLEALRIVPVSPAWIALAKLSESLWRVLAVLLLMAAAGAEWRSLYLSGGRRLGLGLMVGLAGAAVCAGLAFLPMLARPGGGTKLVSLAPWVVTFVLANGFAEELLFRGLFLQPYEAFLGKGLANLLAASAFTLLHLQVTYVSELAVFLLVLFPLALAWGWLMQKTGSIWGSALFHAGADCLLIFGTFGKP
jgi:membrane protease YdiL (CAAX protease family)